MAALCFVPPLPSSLLRSLPPLSSPSRGSRRGNLIRVAPRPASASATSSSSPSPPSAEAPHTPPPSLHPGHAPLTGMHRPRDENVPGEFFVDHSCIDCDVCRWMAPGVFSRQGGLSAVHHQPTTPVERLKALQALLACPVAAIHESVVPHSTPTLHSAEDSFPLPISRELPGISHCGYHSPLSFGATPYLIAVQPGLNVLVDSPRYTPALVSQLEAMGGVQAMFLTHRDDVADHDKWAAHFGCQRIMHSAEVSPQTEGVEVKLSGEGPWAFPMPQGVPATQADCTPTLTIIHTPGHTAGSCCLLVEYPGEDSPGALFTGDHLSLAEDDTHLDMHLEHNWQSVDLQKESIRKLGDLQFLWILPGHGRRHRFSSRQDMLASLEQLL